MLEREERLLARIERALKGEENPLGEDWYSVACGLAPYTFGWAIDKILRIFEINGGWPRRGPGSKRLRNALKRWREDVGRKVG